MKYFLSEFKDNSSSIREGKVRYLGGRHGWELRFDIPKLRLLSGSCCPSGEVWRFLKSWSVSGGRIGRKPEVRGKKISPLDWIEKNSGMLKRFKGKWIAFVPEKGVLGYGDDPEELFKKFHPKNKSVIIHYIPDKPLKILF